MFSIAYVVLPFSDAGAPADAIRASLAPFQMGGRRENLPDEWLAFDDQTEDLRIAHETWFTFIDEGKLRRAPMDIGPTHSGVGIFGPWEDALTDTLPAGQKAGWNPPLPMYHPGY